MTGVQNRLNHLRTNKGESLSTLSQILKDKYKISVSPSQLNYYEKGERFPRNQEVWDKLADHFGVPVGYLLGYDPVEFGKVFLPQTSEDFSEVLEIGKNRIADILGMNSQMFIESNLQNNESVRIPDKVNLLIAIGLLPLDYADVILHYSILTDEKAEVIRELIKVSIPDPVEEAKQLHQRISKVAGSMAVWGDDTNKIKDLGKRIEDALKDNNEEPKS